MIRILAASLLFVMLFSRRSIAVEDAAALPEGIQTRMHEEYPGWKLAEVTRTVWGQFKKSHKNHHPSLLKADFDQDGKPDYAIHVVILSPGNEEQFLTVFLEREGGWEEAIVESRGIDPTVYLTTRKNRLIIAGGPMGDSAYAWENGQFREAALDATLVTGETLTLP